MITVSHRHAIPPLIDPLDPGPLNRLMGLDERLVAARGQIHEQAMGFDYATCEYMSRREYIITVNPPELPA